MTPVHVPAALSRERMIQNALRDLGISTTQYSIIVGGISQQKIDAGFRGVRAFTQEQIASLENGIRELQELCAAIAPVVPDWRHVLAVKAALEQRRKQV